MNRIERQRKYEQISASCAPIIKAKNYAMQKMIETGKKMGKLRYLMLAVLFLFLFTYHFCFSILTQLHTRQKLTKALSGALAVVMIITSVNMTAFAVENLNDSGEDADINAYTITAMSIDADLEITVAPGTEQSEIGLPDYVSATVVCQNEIRQEESEATSTPEASETPEEILTSSESETPEETSSPGESETPEETTLPEESETPAETPIPEESTAPEMTPEPEEIPEQENEAPEEIPAPEEPPVENNDSEEIEVSDAGNALTQVIDFLFPSITAYAAEADPILENEEASVTTKTIDLPIIWTSEDYDAQIEGTYTFTAAFSENTYEGHPLVLAEDVTMPTVQVVVEDQTLLMANGISLMSSSYTTLSVGSVLYIDDTFKLDKPLKMYVTKNKCSNHGSECYTFSKNKNHTLDNSYRISYESVYTYGGVKVLEVSDSYYYAYVREFSTITVRAGSYDSYGTTIPGKGSYDVAEGERKSFEAMPYAGYKFSCWNGGHPSLQYSNPAVYDYDKLDLNGTFGFSPVFIPITFSIAFDKNQGTDPDPVTGTMTNQSCNYNSSLKNNAYQRKRYLFNGWNTKANGTGTSYANNASVSSLATTSNDSKTITLYAQWKLNEILKPATVTVKYNGTSANISDVYAGAELYLKDTAEGDTYIPMTSSAAGTYTTTQDISSLKQYDLYYKTGGSYHLLAGNAITDFAGAVSFVSIANDLTNLSTSNTNTAMQITSDYETTLTLAMGCELQGTVEVTCGGNPLMSGSGYSYNAETGALTIYQASLNGAIVIKGTGVKKTFSLTVPTGDGYQVTDTAGIPLGEGIRLTYGEAYHFKVSTKAGYNTENIAVSYQVNTGVARTPTVEGDIYTIPGEAVTGAVAITVSGVADTTAPVGEIQVGTSDSNKWNSFLQDITFGLFFKETQNVTITAADENGSGLDTIKYFLSDKALVDAQGSTTEGDIKNLGIEWKPYSVVFPIDPDKKLVVYAKLQDKAGNVRYISSDGLVLDSTAPVIGGVNNGGVYAGATTITITETNLAATGVTVMNDGMKVPISPDSAGKIVLQPSQNPYSITVTDQAGNVTGPVTITINWREIAVPAVVPKNYTGAVQTADITISEDTPYTVTANAGGIHVKSDYPVVFTLKNTANDRWAGQAIGTASVTVPFSIKKETNSYTKTLTCAGYVYDKDKKPIPQATAQFGKMRFTFSSKRDGSYTAAVPVNAGTYYVKAEVTGTDDYTALTMTNEQAVEFTIANAAQTAPEGVGKTDETFQKKADGTLTGVTTAMEYRYSTDGGTIFGNWITFSDISDGIKKGLPSGTYEIRYKVKTNYDASPKVSRTITAGRALVLTFKAEGSPDQILRTDYNVTLTEGSTPPLPTVPARTGYTVDNSLSSNHGWLQESKRADFSNIIEDTVYTAKYLPIVSTITLNKADGTGGINTIYSKYDNGYYTNLACSDTRKMTAVDNRINIPTRTGYTFKGYYTAASGGIQVITSDGGLAETANNQMFATESGDLYAQWGAESYRIDIVINNKNNVTSTINGIRTTYATTEYDDANTIVITPDSGYEISSIRVFVGEKLQESVETTEQPHTFNIQLSNYKDKSAGNVGVYVEVVPIMYSINYLDKGNKDFSGTFIGQHPLSYAAVSGLVLPGAEKKGYAFAGWFDNATCSGNEIEEIEPLAVNRPNAVYAKWDLIYYTVTLDTEVGSVNAEGWDETLVGSHIYQKSYDITKELLLPTAEQITKPGFHFAGWYDNADCSGVVYTKIPTDTTGDMTFHAKWERKSYQVTLTEGEGYTATALSSINPVPYQSSYSFKIELKPGYSLNPQLKVYAKNSDTGVKQKLTAEGSNYTITSVEAPMTILVEGVADITKPTAEISIEKNKWTEFLQRITFEIFFNKTIDVTITAADQNTGSGLDKIYYHLSSTELSEDAVKLLTDADWKVYNGQFSMQEEKAYIVYVKATDKANNAVYINSSGIVLDKTTPVIPEIENNGTYYGDKTFTVAETNLQEVKVDGVIIKANDQQKYVVSADNGEHTIVVTDYAGHERQYTITVYKIYTVTYMAEGTVISTQQIGYGMSAVAPIVPDKPGCTGAWNDDGVNITADTIIEAVYTKIVFKVTLPTNQTGYTLKTDKSSMYWHDSVTLTFALKPGYYKKARVFAVNVNGVVVDVSNGSYIIDNVESDITVTVDGVAAVITSDPPSISEPTPVPLPKLTPTPAVPLPVVSPIPSQITEMVKPEKSDIKTDNEAVADNEEETDNARNTEGTEKPQVEVNYEESKDKPVITESILEVSYGEGTVIVTVESVDEQQKTDGDVITGVVVSSIDNVMRAVLTEEEMQAVADGEDVEVRLIVTKMVKTIPQEDQNKIEKMAGETAEEIKGFTLATYLDITVEKKIGNGEWKRLNSLDEELEITLDIPEEFRQDNTTYWVIKDHDGIVTLLEDLDDNANTVTVKTGEFSTYALAYSAPDLSEKTVAASGWYWWLLLGTVVVGACTILILYKKKKQDSEETNSLS